MIKIIITGPSGSGKSTLASKLRAQGLIQAQLHVVGPKREHHNEHEYIHSEYEPIRWETDKFADKTYDQWRYILYLKEVMNSDFVVLPPAMIAQFKDSRKFSTYKAMIGVEKFNPMIIYLDYPRDVRLLRIEQRDGKITDEAVRRLQSDEADFQDFMDYTIRVDSDFLYP